MLKCILGNGMVQSERHLVSGKLALLFSLFNVNSCSFLGSDYFLLIDLSSFLSLHLCYILFLLLSSGILLDTLRNLDKIL